MIIEVFYLLVFMEIVFSVYPDDYSGWSAGDTLLPRASSSMAVGYDAVTDKIWLVGGENVHGQTQLISFQNDIFTDHGENYFDESIGQQNSGQYYTQLNEYLYMLTTDGSHIQRFNVQTLSFDATFLTVPITSASACLASLDSDSGYLFVIGGGGTENVQIFDMSTSSWLSSVPSMTLARDSVTCIAHKDTLQLFAIGGEQVEVLPVHDFSTIQNHAWEYIGDLNRFNEWNRAVIYGNDILVIGGAWYDEHILWQYMEEINVIDTTTNTIALNGEMDTKFHSGAPIVVNEKAYCFGGVNNMFSEFGSIYMSSWRYVSLLPPTAATTSNPSSSPTNNPSIAPSKAPTKIPTENPTYKVCTGLDEVNWDLLNTVGQAAISTPDISSVWNPATLQLNVDVILEYITRSKYTFVEQYDSDRGITYVIDTEPFLSDGRYLSDANNCENRESASFAGKSWTNEYWSYSNKGNGLNSINYLEYGPANIWTLDWDIECQTVKYSKSFSFDELLGCKNKDNQNTFVFVEDKDWLNLTGSFYVTLTSPLINQNDASSDNGQYLTNTIGNYPIEISFPRKIASVRDPAIRFFDISVFAVQYDEENSKLLIDILSYSAEYINLINVNIVTPTSTYVSNIESITINEDTSYSDECLFETTYRCFQKFQIEIDLLSCPSTSMDLSTPIILQTEPSCRPGKNCELFESEFGSPGTTTSLADTLSYVESCDQEIYIQTFDGTIKYYDDIGFSNEVDETHEFSIGATLYVDVSVDDIEAYGVFSIDILNVWICATALTNLEISSQLTGEGGCIEHYASNDKGANIDEIYQPFKDGSVYDTDLNGQIYSSLNKQSVRFSLKVPSFQRNKFWLHAIVNLKLQNNSRRRVRLLLAVSNFGEGNNNDNGNAVSRLSHYIKDVSITDAVQISETYTTTAKNDLNTNSSFLYYVYITYFVSLYNFLCL